MGTNQIDSREIRAQLGRAVRDVAGDLKPLVTEVMPTLLQRDDLVRAFQTLRRIESAHDGDKSDATELSEIHRDFTVLVRGHILCAKGHTHEEIGAILGDERVVGWLHGEQIPLSMYLEDPTRYAHFIKHMQIPDGVSTDFAYVLGAYAGTRFADSQARRVTIQSSSPELIEMLCARVTAACGISMHVRVIDVGPQTYHSASSAAHEFTEYLNGVTCGNSAVPWSHIQTSEERREFLRGLLDFGGGMVDLPNARFSISRRDNPRLLEDVAIMLKREGVNSRLRVSEVGGLTTLFLDASIELLAFHDLDVLRRPELAQRLEALCEQPSTRQLIAAADYDSVMETARRLQRAGRISAVRVIEALIADNHPCQEVPKRTIHNWINGEFEPPSVKRRRELESLERASFTTERREEIGHGILQRLPEFPHPYVVVNAIAGFLGGARSLASLAQVNRDVVERALKREQLPDGQTYRAILGIVGLENNARIESGAHCPDVDTIRALFSEPTQQYLFATYRSSIMLRVKGAFERGEDTVTAAREALGQTIARAERVNR